MNLNIFRSIDIHSMTDNHVTILDKSSTKDSPGIPKSFHTHTRSSAYAFNLIFKGSFKTPFINIFNNIGPKIVPCGTPLVTGMTFDLKPLNLTKWLRFNRKLLKIKIIREFSFQKFR